MDVFSLKFRVFPESDKQRLDCAGASGLGFRALIFCFFASTFAPPFCHRFCMLFGSTWEPRFTTPAAEAGTPCYCLIRLIQKVHYTTVLAPLRRFSLQPKGFFRRTRGRIYVAFGEHPAAGVCVCVCSSKVVVLLLWCLFVCVVWLFVYLCLSLFLWLVGWLFVSMCACLFVFCRLAAQFRALVTPRGTFLYFCLHFGGP